MGHRHRDYQVDVKELNVDAYAAADQMDVGAEGDRILYLKNAFKIKFTRFFISGYNTSKSWNEKRATIIGLGASIDWLNLIEWKNPARCSS